MKKSQLFSGIVNKIIALGVMCGMLLMAPSGNYECMPIDGCRASPASDVSKTFWEYVSCTERTIQGNEFELISTVKMETTHPVEFPAICNHSGVMAA